jgi:hypothetical protein
MIRLGQQAGTRPYARKTTLNLSRAPTMSLGYPGARLASWNDELEEKDDQQDDQNQKKSATTDIHTTSLASGFSN